MSVATRLLRPAASAALLVAVMVIAGCGARDPASQHAKAEALLSKGDTKSAIVTLKSLLQQGADSAQTRFLLGRALLASGDTALARVELDKALELGHPADVVVPMVARSYVLSGEYEALISRYGLTTLKGPAANASLHTSLAVAYSGSGRFAQAQQMVETALKSDPAHVPARVFAARLRADGGALPAALEDAAKILAEAPNDPDAWQLKGDLQALGQRDFAGALPAYRKAAELDPRFMPAHVAIMSFLLAPGGDLAQAKSHLDEMLKAMPHNGMTRYFEAWVALRTGETERAQEIVQLLLRVAPDNPRVLQLGGFVEYARGTYARAASLLAKQMQITPADEVSRRLLASTHLRLGQPDRTLTVLRPLMERARPDSASFKLAAQAELQLGHAAAAQKHFATAARLDPADKGSRAALAYGRITTGDVAGGLADLQLLAADEDSTAADLPLVATLMNERRYDEALKALDQFQRKAPKQALPLFLRARVLAAQGDKAAAREAYDQALTLQPTYVLAADALAAMDLAAGRPAEAQAHYDRVLKADPRNVQAMLAIARLKTRAGAPTEQVVESFTAAIQSNPSEVQPRLALVNFLLANKDVKAALQAAQQADAAVPDQVDIVEALGRAQAASGDTNQAVLTYNKLIQLRPNTAEPYLRLADALWAAGKRDNSVETLKRALLIEPEHLQAQRALFDAYLSLNRPDDATTVARQIQKQRPDQPLGYLLEGSVPASKRKWDQALAIYRGGLKVVPDSADLAERVHVVLTLMGQRAEATRHAEDWLKAQPKNAAFPMYLGDQAMANRDHALAQTRYRETLRRDPNHPLALNNLAWLLLQDKKPEALELARRANDVLPNRPILMDTLALALASQGQAAQGVEVLRQAMLIEPGNPLLRLNLARLLIQSGDKPAARTELEALAKLGTKFPRQGEVSELMKTL